MKRTSLFLTFLFIFSQILLFSEILVLQPGTEGKDTYICDCSPDTNNPNGSVTHLYQGQYGTCFDRTLIEWDLSQIPENFQIQSAVMELNFNSLYGSESGDMAYYLIQEAWIETEVTFNSQPEFDPTTEILTDWPEPNSWHQVDITALVQYWLDNPDQNFGVYCHAINTTGTCVAGFNSSDHPNSELHPKLTIDYNVTYADENSITIGGDIYVSNYPNPFNPETKIIFTTEQEFAHTEVSIYNIRGQKIKELINKSLPRGEYKISWDGKNYENNIVESGLYLIGLKVGDSQAIRKTLLLK
ncbi:DNRLRE domain-containing protein [Candidatus Cloacimonadota bacterium]